MGSLQSGQPCLYSHGFSDVDRHVDYLRRVYSDWLCQRDDRRIYQQHFRRRQHCADHLLDRVGDGHAAARLPFDPSQTGGRRPCPRHVSEPFLRRVQAAADLVPNVSHHRAAPHAGQLYRLRVFAAVRQTRFFPAVRPAGIDRGNAAAGRFVIPGDGTGSAEIGRAPQR